MKEELPKFKMDEAGNIKVEQWVYLYIYGLEIDQEGKVIDRENKKIIWEIEIPRTMWIRTLTQNRIKWILSRFIYFHPRMMIQMSTRFYDKKTGLGIGYQQALTNYNSNKRQLTKYKNQLSKFKKDWQPTLLNQKVEEHEIYLKLQTKIEEREMMIEQSLARVRSELSDLKKEK